MTWHDVLLLAPVVIVAAIALVAVVGGTMPPESLEILELQFVQGLNEAEVQSFLTAIRGLLPPWWRRWLVRPFVVLEVEGSGPEIAHRLLVADRWLDIVEQQLRASIPNLQYEQGATAELGVGRAVEYRVTDRHRTLEGDTQDLSAKLLASLQPLSTDERIVVQWLVAPTAPPRVVRARTNGTTGSRALDTLWYPGNRVERADVRAAQEKQSSPMLLATARIGVRAASSQREASLLRRSEVAFHAASAPGVHLRRRYLPSAFAARRLVRRSLPIGEWSGTLNVAELSALLGWPIGLHSVPGLRLSGHRRLAPNAAIGSIGTILADSDYAGAQRPIALDLEARLRHCHIISPTGGGKSWLLGNMILSDLGAGYGVVVLDAGGDLVEDVLARVPAERRDDIVVLNAADTTRPIGLNPLRPPAGVSGEVVVENLVGILHSLYRGLLGPRSDDILRAVFMLLVATGDATLCDVPLVLTDANFRRRLLRTVDDPVGLGAFYGWFESLSQAERLNVVAAPLNKIRAFTMRPTVRGIVGQATPALSMSDVLATGKVLLVPLSPGLLGEEAASLLGALVVAQLWHATTARAVLAPAQRRPVMVYLDEWQRFLHLPTPMASVLAEARSLGLGVTLAHQHLGQTPTHVRNAVMANARSRVIFQLQSTDARLLAHELGDAFGPSDLQGLGAYEVVIQAFADGATQPPATGRTRPLPPVTTDADALREQSRLRYGRARADVERAILDRQTAGSGDGGPIRRRRARGETD